MLILLLLLLVPATNANSYDKLDLTDLAIKCGSCPCVNPCSQQLPPPPPSPPPPPTPTPPNNPSIQYCPPPPQTPPPPRFIYVTSTTPPPPRFIYVTGPPGNLYPTNPFNLQVYSTGGRQVVLGSLPTVCCGVVLGLLMLLF